LGKDINEKTTADRLKTAFRKKPEIWDIEVKRLKDTRNKMVHRGLLEATVEETYFAKVLYEFTLGLLLKYGTEYKDENTMKTLLELAGEDPTTLSEVKRAIDYLLQT